MSPAAGASNSVSFNSWHQIGHQNQIQQYGHINNARRYGWFIVKEWNNSKSKSNPSLSITTVSTRTTFLHASASSSSSASGWSLLFSVYLLFYCPIPLMFVFYYKLLFYCIELIIVTHMNLLIIFKDIVIIQAPAWSQLKFRM